jgi:protein-tyrosine phosphatase
VRGTTRDLEWPDSFNIRDLGGLPTANAGTTKRRSFVRADVLCRLTQEGKRMLIDYGVRTVIDLRFPKEFEELPAVVFDAGAGDEKPDYLNVPFGADSRAVSARIAGLEDPSADYCVWLESFPDAVRDVMRAVLSSRSGGVIFHCRSGKDRTGMVAALLLSLADVPRNVIVDDYTWTDKRLRPLYDANLMNPNANRAVADRMRLMLEFLDEDLGGVVEFLKTTGLGDEEIVELRSRLL